jgi:hypothetical protein
MTVITILVATVKEAVLSSSDHSQIQDLQSRFEEFRQQFDRGVSVQSALNLEDLLTEIGTESLFKLENFSKQLYQHLIEMRRYWLNSNAGISTKLHRI